MMNVSSAAGDGVQGDEEVGGVVRVVQPPGKLTLILFEVCLACAVWHIPRGCGSVSALGC